MLAFYALYNCHFPFNLRNFLHHLFKYLVNWHRKVFEGAAWGNNEHKSEFRENWLNDEYGSFYREKVYNHFTI